MFGPSVSMKKASTKDKMTTAKKLPMLEIDVVRILPKSSVMPREKFWTMRKISPWRFSIPKVWPILSKKPSPSVALLKIDGRLLKNLMDSLMTVGTTTERKAIIKPTTRIYDKAIPKLRFLLGSKLANVLTNGEIASAKKSAAKIIDRPKLAL